MSSYRSYHGLESESELRSETDWEAQSVSTWKVGANDGEGNLLHGHQTDQMIVDEFDEDEPDGLLCEEACPEFACRYCLTSNPECVVKCTICNKWFCNGNQATSGAHIVHHMVRAKHREAALHPKGPLADTALECYCCGSKNVFLLGYVPKKEDFVVVLICREPCLVQNAFKDSQWDTTKWEPLISNRMFLPWLVKEPDMSDKRRLITPSQVAKLEEIWKDNPTATLKDMERIGTMNSGVEEEEETRPVTLRYEDAYQYQHTFAPLVKMEADYDKRMKESQSQQNVKVRWDIALNKKRLAMFYFTKETNDIRLAPGDELRLKHEFGIKHPESGQMVSWECQGTVTKINSQEEVCLELRNAEKKGPWDNELVDGFTVEFVWKSTSFDRMQTAMRIFAVNETSVSGYLYHRLLGHDPEQQEIRQYLNVRHYQAPNLPALNHSQSYAVKKALYSPLQLIQGPPGTGKTVTSATIVYHMCRNAQEHCRQERISPQHAQVLVCAPSNIAVDQLAEKLHKTGLSVVRVVARSREHIPSNVEYLCLHRQIAHLDTADNKQLQRLAELKNRMGGELNAEDEKTMRNLTMKCEKLLLMSANVICTTCVGAGDVRLQQMRFRQVLIDESTQATEPECLIPITNGAKQVVLVGDHCQLGPVIMCKRAAKAGLHQSLFERLVHLNARPIRLEVQYRMHPCLSEFPSHSFYDGSLQNGVTLKDRTYHDMGGFPWPKPSMPMFFYNSTGLEEISVSGTSYLNRTEASNIEKIIAYFLKARIKPEQIGVITPYEGQRSYITTLLQRSATVMQTRGFEEIEVASVDSFQGREKDFIILSCVRSNTNLGIGFLNDPRRLNVALTRAKYGLVICGNAKVLAKVYKGTSLWLNLLAHMKKSDLVVEGPLANLKSSNLELEAAPMRIGGNMMMNGGGPMGPSSGPGFGGNGPQMGGGGYGGMNGGGGGYGYNGNGGPPVNNQNYGGNVNQNVNAQQGGYMNNNDGGGGPQQNNYNDGGPYGNQPNGATMNGYSNGNGMGGGPPGGGPQHYGNYGGPPQYGAQQLPDGLVGAPRSYLSSNQRW
ncbi:unnamed protein product [Amoebophrya sp. A120]|nr:unnamed protein product [Amoebophrya sp. A120]|eukprot:GSA120T00019273001.1